MRKFIGEAEKPVLKKGFTLIESLVFLFLFSVIALVFLQVVVVGTRIILDSKNRLGAVALANQKMEIIRSIEYETIGTKSWNGSTWVYGIPGGELLQEEDISINNRLYQVSTFVQYVDDAFDGTTTSNPVDAIPTDYKRVRVQVSWGNEASERVILFGSFTPNGLETAVAGGTLSINVLHSDGSGVSGASVNIQNEAGTINVNAVTDATGNVSLPGTPDGNRTYIVTVSKNDYFGASTFPPYPTNAFTPVDVHATVVANTLNQISIIMDRSVDLPLQTVNPYDEAIPNIGFNFKGGRILGTDPNTGEDVVTVNDNNLSTGSSGEYVYNDVSYGLYTFALTSGSSSQYELFKILPETGSVVNQIDTIPGSNQVYKIVLLDKNVPSLKVTVANADTLAPLSGASVRLENAGISYDTTSTTDQFGNAFFPTTNTPLTAGDYTVSVTATGYNGYSDSVSIGSSLVKEEVNLTAN